MAAFRSALKAGALTRHSPGFRMAVTNLLALAFLHNPLEREILDYLLGFLDDCDCTVSQGRGRRTGTVAKAEADADFCLRFLFLYIKLRLKGLPSHRRNKDVFLNHFLSFVQHRLPAFAEGKRSRRSGELVAYHLFDSFFNTIVKLERPVFSQYLVLFLCVLPHKLRLCPSFDSFRTYFFHRMMRTMFSKSQPAYLKAKVLAYVQSFLHVCRADHDFVHVVLFYLCQLLAVATKRIVVRVREELGGLQYSELDEEGQRSFKAAFEEPLFLQLLECISNVFDDCFEHLPTATALEAIRSFKNYVLKFGTHLKAACLASSQARQFFVRMNRFLGSSFLQERLLASNIIRNEEHKTEKADRPEGQPAKSLVTRSTQSQTRAVAGEHGAEAFKQRRAKGFNLFAQSRLPFFQDHLREHFKLSAIGCARPKSLCELDGAFAPELLQKRIPSCAEVLEDTVASKRVKAGAEV